MNLIYLWAPLITVLLTSLTTTGGVGGAFILVPIFAWLGLPIYEAETLGLFMALFSSSTACIGYHHGGHIKYKTAATLIAGMLVFSPLASYLSAVVNKNFIYLVFCLLLLLLFLLLHLAPTSPA